MAFQFTVLGSAGSHAGPGRVCSGYLLTASGTRVLLDCGNGSTATLQRFCTFHDLDAVVVTHRHVDHCIDLIGMFYALRFHRDGQRTLRLYAAPEVHDLLTGLLSDDSAFAFDEVFDHVEIHPGDRFEVGALRFTCYPSLHPVPTVSVRAEAEGRTLTYSSDSAGGSALVEAAAGADLLLCEATWQGDESAYPSGIHLTARGAGRVAARAGVRRLMLTHVLGSLDPEQSLKEAAETFDGELLLAREGETTTV